MDPASPPPPPPPTGIERLVCEDIATRQQFGLNKYGVSVEASPAGLLEWNEHAYLEMIDGATYLKKQRAVLIALLEENRQLKDAVAELNERLHERTQGFLRRRCLCGRSPLPTP